MESRRTFLRQGVVGGARLTAMMMAAPVAARVLEAYPVHAYQLDAFETLLGQYVTLRGVGLAEVVCVREFQIDAPCEQFTVHLRVKSLLPAAIYDLESPMGVCHLYLEPASGYRRPMMVALINRLQGQMI